MAVFKKEYLKLLSRDEERLEVKIQHSNYLPNLEGTLTNRSQQVLLCLPLSVIPLKITNGILLSIIAASRLGKHT